MSKQVFVIGIGGTGMRCLESFVHLCAMGMFDDHDVNMLALDTDRLNGNFARLQELVGFYTRINKGNLGKDTLFSARIHYGTFTPDYDKNNVTFNSISDYSSASSLLIGDEVKYRESDLCDLFLDPNVRAMDLAHGYRAQTQLGSMLMYHAIIEEAYKTKRTDYNSYLRSFIQQLNESNGNQVFIFGSVFGGTGASSIPIIPRAFQRAAEIMFGEQAQVLEKNFYGSVIMTNYFSFDIQKQDAIVATSDKFALNSQAALAFYSTDKTVRDTYKRLYMLGRENMRNISIAKADSDTGGAKQKNPVDYLELMAAFAAYDFFKTCDGGVDAFKSEMGKKSNFYYITIQPDDSNRLISDNFTSADKAKFEEKSGIMLATCLLDAVADFFVSMKNTEFQGIPEDEITALHDYFVKFYNVTGDMDGWLPQMYTSAKEGGFHGLLFDAEPFAITNLKKLKFNERLFIDENHAFKLKGGFLGMGGNIFDTVRETFKDVLPTEQGNLSNLLKRLYLTFHKLYGFDN
ncbi:hypothetical protein [uncultured Bacteroides sp.]|uniref:hypothetical protein n=1 Tax=uncultured Bacteroides sp. TaxID=162156 RepID=UPI00260909DE|nr:hypothetical protein [uncultured Bacteroides sp.]